MNRKEFESKVKELWAKSRIPLTEANLQYFAKVKPKKLVEWIDELLDSGFLDIDVTQASLQYTVPGVARSTDGPTNGKEYERKRALVEEAKRRILARRAGKTIEPSKSKDTEKQKAVEKTRTRKKQKEIEEDEDEDEDEDDEDGMSVVGMVGKAALFAGGKALVVLDKPLAMLDKPKAKGDKSLLASAGLSLVGPLGWLYAGSFREAIPATMAYIAVGYVLPSFVFAPFLLFGSLISSGIGLTYAWQYNRKKGRTPLFLSKKNKDRDKDKDES